MKKLLLLLPLLALLFIISCEKESYDDLQMEQEIYDNNSLTLRSPAPKIDVCHYDAENDSWHVITISQNAWPAHEGHGDVILIDEDVDGYVTQDNECMPTDCDDTDAELTDNCSTSCVEGELEVTLPDGTIIYVHPTDNSTGIPWGDFNNDIDGLDNITSSPGANVDFDGAANTAAIVADLGNWNGGDYAANLCATLSAKTGCEWYLPAAGELNAMYQQLGPNGSGDMSSSIYWSSTEGGGFLAWDQVFNFGSQFFDYKSFDFNCRCVRR